MGPLDAADEAAARSSGRATSSIRSRWTTLGEYLDYLQRKGVAPNVASFVGATTVRVHELGEKDVDPTPAQLDADARARPRRRWRKARWASARR